MNSVEPVFKCPLKCNEIFETKPDVLRHLESGYHKIVSALQDKTNGMSILLLNL